MNAVAFCERMKAGEVGTVFGPFSYIRIRLSAHCHQQAAVRMIEDDRTSVRNPQRPENQPEALRSRSEADVEGGEKSARPRRVKCLLLNARQRTTCAQLPNHINCFHQVQK